VPLGHRRLPRPRTRPVERHHRAALEGRDSERQLEPPLARLTLGGISS